MKDRKTPAPMTNIGIASLLVIFLVLCLVVFAALSLSTATNDYKQSLKQAQHVTEYYEGESYGY